LIRLRSAAAGLQRDSELRAARTQLSPAATVFRSRHSRV